MNPLQSLRKLAQRATCRGTRQAAGPLAGGAPTRRTSSRPAEPPSDLHSLVEQMLQQGRFALLMRPELIGNLSSEHLVRCQAALSEAMALCPEGDVVMGRTCSSAEEELAEREERELPRNMPIQVERHYLDRYPVTNAAYYEFVVAQGYEQLSIWEPEILPGVLDFVDSTGRPGPRFWRHGAFLPGTDDHPVVGVNWYEACAYARWVGRRLPTDPEWEKAGSWPVHVSATQRSQRRYPWGDTMDRRRCRLWDCGEGTAPVTANPDGVSVGGVHQLVGNVWEWTCGNYGSWQTTRRDFLLPTAMKSIRGGAFDTYFDHHASCQFQSGEDPLARKHNIGFRCALGWRDIADPVAIQAVMDGGALVAEEATNGNSAYAPI